MKKFLLFVLIAVAALGCAAQNLFTPGAVYEYDFGIQDPKKDWVVTMTLEDAGTYFGRECLGIYADNFHNTGEEHQLVLVIYVEGDCDKVYYLPREDEDKWYLMYDFTLQPGDECVAYRPYLPDWNEDRNDHDFNTVVCSSREPQSDIAVDSEVICLQEDHMPGFKWIKGFGSEVGIYPNIWGNLQGYYGIGLLKATTPDGFVVYERAGIHDVESAEAAPVVSGNTVTAGARPVSVYGIDGRPAGSAASGESVKLSDAGIYIISERGGTARKAVVR